MAKQTKKYVAAISAVRAAGLSPYFGADASDIYSLLASAGYQWDANAGQWIKLLDQPADEPSDLIRIRVWADGEKVGAITDAIVGRIAILKKGFELIERSDPYPCRPPKQKESRVYLTYKERK